MTLIYNTVKPFWQQNFPGNLITLYITTLYRPKMAKDSEILLVRMFCLFFACCEMLIVFYRTKPFLTSHGVIRINW